MIISKRSLRNLILEEMDSVLPRCKRKRIYVDSTPINVEVADNDFLRNQGLMFRRSLPADEGMLFIFPESASRGFWMKNTHIPLSIAFIDGNGTITNIENMAPNVHETIYSSGPAKLALEMNQGWFRENEVFSGSSIFL